MKNTNNTYYLLGIAYQANKDNASALKAFQKALEFNPKDKELEKIIDDINHK